MPGCVTARASEGPFEEGLKRKLLPNSNERDTTMTETVQNPSATGAQAMTLAERLREVSLSGHGRGDEWGSSEEAAEPQYSTAYLRGGLNRAGVAAQVAQHFLMYEALEAATLAHRERLGEDFVLWMPELHRLESLRNDAQYWMGDDWENEVRTRYATPGIMRYVERLNGVAATSYPHFVAHHYTRYLADLSGGLMIAKMFRRSYEMTGNEGTSFYDFPAIEDPRAWKDRYRSLLDTMEFSEQEKDAIVEEVALAYQLNNEAGSDLEARFAEYKA